MKGEGSEEMGAVLAEQLPDLLVHVAEEVHVGGSARVVLVLHQEVLEDELQLVILFHHHQLGERQTQGNTVRYNANSQTNPQSDKPTVKLEFRSWGSF